jgi:myosin heavy subunit
MAMALTMKSVGAKGKSVTMKSYMLPEAESARDALAKELYGKLFSWLIKKTNVSLSGGKGATNVSDGLAIGVLDIFGFEIFEVNSFEQLCINYCNEKLQHHFNDHIFKVEQKFYASEGVSVSSVDFQNNEDTLMLLEGAGGLLSLIDDEVSVPRGTDMTLLGKIKSKHDKHAHFARAPPSAKHAAASFTVKHYAGDVVYCSANFLEKNKDKLVDDLSSALLKSTSGFTQALFEEPAPAAEASGGRGRARAATLGKKFKAQLQSLVKIMVECDPHFVRCVKPNHVKRPRIFQSAMALMQIKCAGLLEVCRVRQIGYPNRVAFEDFLQVRGSRTAL